VLELVAQGRRDKEIEGSSSSRLRFSFAVVAITAAIAGSLHIKAGGTPTCSASSTTLSCTGSLAGLGNAPVTIAVSSPAEATLTRYVATASSRRSGMSKFA
jgi:hypothetical protein